MRPTLILVAMISLALSGCVGPADRARLQDDRVATDALEPTFSAIPSDAAGDEPRRSSTEGPSPAGPPAGTSANTPETAPDETGAPPDGELTSPASDRPAPASAALHDPTGDVTGFGSPDWADLQGARLVRADTGFTLTHVLAAPAPQEGDGQETMNIATFFDVDGDGEIDYEIWANLSSNGWGTSYFDEREGTARYAADDGVDVDVVDGDVQLRFPASHLGDAPSFRWSIASEYGPYQAIGTDAMARDYLPDDRSGRPFPD